MHPIDIKPTANTPAVLFNVNKLQIKGRSIPLSDARFYEPFIEWAGNLELGSLEVELNLEYMNSGSTKKILELLNKLDNNQSIKKLHVAWYYEEGDDEMLEHGRIFEKLLKKAVFRFIGFRDQ